MKISSGQIVRWLTILLLIPLVQGNTTFSVIDPAPDGFTATPTFAVFDGDVLGTHQNFAFEVFQEDNVLFSTQSLHEHDGITTMLYTVPSSGTITYRITGDETIVRNATISPAPAPTASTLTSMDGTRLQLEGDELRIIKTDTKGIRGQWILRDEQGIVLSGWVASQGLQELPLAIVHGDSELRAELFLVGRAGARAVSATGITGPAVSALPAAEDLQLSDCTDGVILDPAEVVAGNSIRFLKADYERITGQPKEHRVDYELRRMDEPIGQSVLYQWFSAGPMAQTSFRVPSPGEYALVVSELQESCQLRFTAVEGSSETALLETSFKAGNGTITAFADVPGSGHYEYPSELRYLNNGTEGSKLVWAGKLHSHGGGVNFTASNLPDGTYEWIVDVGAQGPDPIVKTGLSGHRIMIELKTEIVEEEKESPFLPVILVALALIALGRARR